MADDKAGALYTILKEDVEECYQCWNDEEMMAELDKSEADFRSGKDSGITWEALKAELLSHQKKCKLIFYF